MTTPVSNLTLVPSMDEDLALARFGDGPAGPAGLVQLELANGASCLFDKAEPARLLELAVELNAGGPPASATTAVAAVLGPDAAGFVEGGAHAGALVLGPDAAAVVARLGRLALLDDVRPGPAQPLAGVWAAEWAALAASLDERLGLDERAQAEAEAGLDALLGGDAGVVGDQPWVARRVVEVGEEVQRLVGSAHPRAAELQAHVAELRRALDEEIEAGLAALFEVIEMSSDDSFMVASGAPALAASALGADTEFPNRRSYLLEPALVPADLLRAGAGIKATYDPEAGVVEVTCKLEVGADHADVGRLWARAFDQQGVMVALTCLHAEGDSARARLVVGADLDLVHTQVEVTAKPTLPPASPSLVGLRRAHDHAHAALRAERLGHFEAGAAAWRSCAGDWAELGDVADQGAALALAARDLALAGISTEASALAARARQVAGKDLAVPEPEEPFLGEAMQALKDA